MKLNRKNKSNKLVIPILVLSLLFISIGYSYLETTLSIDGDVSFDDSIKKTTIQILGKEMEVLIDNTKSKYVTDQNGINFSSTSSDTNGKGLYLRAGTENDEYPIAYFRGEVDNNNVLFGGFCWKIVRTTEQGGTKLIYNGVPDANNQCKNTGTASQLSTKSAFNAQGYALADVGYMYGTKYSYNINNRWEDAPYIYASDVSYSNGVYTLEGSETEPNILANVKTKHYTCKSTTGVTCEKVYYVYSLYIFESATLPNTLFALSLELTNGEKIETVLDKSTTNNNDSSVKKVVDTWFKDNLLNQESKLEDAVWCNNRSIVSGGYLKEVDITSDTRYGRSYFGSYNDSSKDIGNNLLIKDVDVCPNPNDRFTKNDIDVGNGDLDYPVGLLNAEEMRLAGLAVSSTSTDATDSYLYTGQYFWGLTPAYTAVSSMAVSVSAVKSEFFGYSTSSSVGVRPSIVLKKGIVVTSGDGSATNPYVVE